MRLLCWAILSLPPTASAQEAASDDLVDRTLEILEAHSVEAPDRAALERAAVEAMLASVDGGRGLYRLVDAPEGQRVGIGADFLVVPQRGLLIRHVPRDTPAWRAGIRAGEAVTGIGGESLQGLSAAEIHDCVRRARGDTLALEIEDAAGRRRTIDVPVAPYTIDPVWFERKDDHAMIRIKDFSRGSRASLEAALARFADQPLVIDLRDNPGGEPAEAAAAADLFLAPGAAIATERRRSGETPFVSTRAPLHREGVVILINGGTTGAAELFAAALRDGDRAFLVGGATAGVAWGTSLYAAGDRALQIADASFVAPSGATWAEQGLAPDVGVDAPPVPMASPRMAPPDITMQAALRLLRSGASPGGEQRGD